MPKRTYYVMLPCGTWQEKISTKWLTHAVAGMADHDREHHVAAFGKPEIEAASFLEFSLIVAAGVGRYFAGTNAHAVLVTQRLHDHAMAQLGRATTLDEYRARLRAARLAKVEEKRAAGHYSRFHVIAWADNLIRAEHIRDGNERADLCIGRCILDVTEVPR